MKKCTCNPGFVLCPEAERLWRKANDFYYSGDYVAYDKALSGKEIPSARLLIFMK
jgi:hypothetical protein